MQHFDAKLHLMFGKCNMKRIFNILTAAVLVMSCSVVNSDMVYDIAPIVSYIYLEDSDGQNMLDPNTREESFDISQISAEFRGQTYAVDMSRFNETGAWISTKAYMPQFSGLMLQVDRYGKWMISFGELDGTEDIDNENLVINWGDGSSNTITIFNNFRWKWDGSPVITRRFYVDGKKQDTDIAVFKFVKNKK